MVEATRISGCSERGKARVIGVPADRLEGTVVYDGQGGTDRHPLPGNILNALE
jgi:hypothetical protein